MKKIVFLISILILSTGYFHTEAQVGSFVKNKAKQAKGMAGKKADEEVTEEMNEEVDKGVEKVFDKFFGADEEDAVSPESSDTNEEISDSDDQNNLSKPAKSSSSSGDAGSNAMLKALGINTTSVNVEETFEYSGNILMNIESWDSDGKSEGQTEYKTYTSDDNSGFAMEFKEDGEGESTMIFDYKNESMIILSNDGETKSGMVTEYSSLSDQMAEAEEDIDTDETTDYSEYREGLKKTGRSKKIAGYKCDEYIYEDDESKSEIWMTDQLPQDLAANMFGSNVMAGEIGFYGGFIMEMDQKEKDSKERVYMLVKEVNEKQHSAISTKGYELISIGGMPIE